MWRSSREGAFCATLLLVPPMSSRILLSWIVRPLLLSTGARHGSFPMSVEQHRHALLHPVRPRTLGMVMAWYHSRRVVLGVVSWSDPLLSLASGSVVALVHNCSFSRIVGVVVVLIRARPFSPTVGLGLSRGPAVWVMLFLLRVLVCAPNCLPLDFPGGS